jgi:hypothetical protein
MLRICLMSMLLLAMCSIADAQYRFRASPFELTDSQWCGETGNRGQEVSSCDIRELSVSDFRSMDVDTGGSGGIFVRGSTGSTVRVRARVVTYAPKARSADIIAPQSVQLSTTGGRIRVDGPREADSSQWSVDLAIEVPHDLPLVLATQNGIIAVNDYSGRANIHTTNGSISLADVGGDFHGETTNGAIYAQLSGGRWEGKGLELKTGNGAVSLTMPEGYSADLQVDAHGGIRTDFPITSQGRRGIDGMYTRLGDGGPQIRVRTAHGNVTIGRR